MKTFLIWLLDKHVVALFVFGAFLHILVEIDTQYLETTFHYLNDPPAQQCVPIQEDIATAKRLLNLK